MSLRTLPLLVVNLGGEMLYILEQRLQAQHETGDRTQRGGWSEDDRKRGTRLHPPFYPAIPAQ